MYVCMYISSIVFKEVLKDYRRATSKIQCSIQK